MIDESLVYVVVGVNGFWGTLVALAVRSILKGSLITRTVHLDRMADKDAQIARLERERNDWKAAQMAGAAAVQELTSQQNEALEAGRTAIAVLEAIKKAASDE
jgi:hypothetical protein